MTFNPKKPRLSSKVTPDQPTDGLTEKLTNRRIQSLMEILTSKNGKQSNDTDEDE